MTGARACSGSRPQLKQTYLVASPTHPPPAPIPRLPLSPKFSFPLPKTPKITNIMVSNENKVEPTTVQVNVDELRTSKDQVRFYFAL